VKIVAGLAKRRNAAGAVRVSAHVHPRTGRIIGPLLLAVVAACASQGLDESPASQASPSSALTDVTCGGAGFDRDLLGEPGHAETFGDPAALALRQVLAQTGPDVGWLPDHGWREITRTDAEVTYLADAPSGQDAPYAVVTVVREDGRWLVAGWSQCRLLADVGPDLGLATFRVDPGVELGPNDTQIPVLVTERACNSGQDARGRIVDPQIVLDDDAVTVVFAVTPRAGDHDCPGNPETPHLLVLPEALGERTLLDGSELPPRDATVCPDVAGCAP
jgi:hypothetical protein